MKKIIIAGLFAVSGFALAQEATDNPYVYETTQDEVAEEDEYPGNPGDPKSAPIDDYIPALFVLAAAIAVRAKMKKKLKESN
ncbi:hypothetical protein [Chryseobacterium echinoideorum]|uniref:hypothetical protein n=1 Tax=Chryseobacterium echinoideorum TaxID=1549648 RepID=UPI001185B265|nr:hypothetical protein [Chryseobacterium echinoideorum]